jgi:hypothetical protein
MEMQNIALTLAGAIGVATAIFHGLLTQKLIVRPITRRLADAPGVSATIGRLVPPLLHYSGFAWLTCGLALIVAAQSAAPDVRLAISLLAGAQYSYAALANLWGTRGRHPGWMLMAASVALIAFDLRG